MDHQNRQVSKDVCRFYFALGSFADRDLCHPATARFGKINTSVAVSSCFLLFRHKNNRPFLKMVAKISERRYNNFAPFFRLLVECVYLKCSELQLRAFFYFYADNREMFSEEFLSLQRIILTS